MRLEKIVHRNVQPDGKMDWGAVETKGGIRMSKNEGCGLSECHCSDGYWISIFLPRTKRGIVEGILCKFDDKKEFNKFMRIHKIDLQTFLGESKW